MRTKTSNNQDAITLTPTIFQILVVLSGGERHGYAILREVEELAAGKARIGPTTLYRSIKAMLGGGLIEELDERPDPELDDERRRYYRMSGFGLKVLNDEVERLESLLKAARKKRVLTGNRQMLLLEGWD